MKRIFDGKAKTIIAVSITAMVLASCGGVVGTGLATGKWPSWNETLYTEQEQADNSLTRIHTREPIPIMYDSSDAHNQRVWYTEQSDPNKIEYLTLINKDGAPYAHFTIKGQVSAMGTSETNTQQVLCNYRKGLDACGTVGMPQPNGIYGGIDLGHFAITTSGAIIEWQGDFVTSDQPFNIKAPVSLSLNENVAPSATNLSGVKGGILPNGRTH